MAKKKRRKKNSTEKLKLTLKYELIGLTIIGLAIIAIAKLGAVGNGTVFLIRFFMGEWYILFLLGAIAAGFYLMIKREVPYLLKRQLVGMYFLVASMLLLSHVTLFNMLADGGPFTKPSVISNTWELFWMEVTGKASSKDLGGGMIGAILFAASYFLFDEAGSKIVSFLFIIVGAVLLTGKTLGETLGKFFRGLGGFFIKQWSAFRDDVKTWNEDKKEKKKNPVKKKKRQNEPVEDTDQAPLEEETQEMATERIISSFADKAYNDENEIIPAVPETAAENAGDQDDAVPPMNFTEVENKEYLLPPLSLLLQPKKTDQSGEYQLIHENAAKLERTFHSFGVKARVTQVHLGPAVTKYEVHPDVGVKVSKIVSLSDDLALALAAKDIRIEAPIPGKSAIGIEVPNSEVAMVSLREVLEAKEVDKPDAKLQIGLGRNISGEAVKAELNKMPHLLVAGATGSGKSVCINGIITSILMRAKPHEVKMMMIDPKMVELNVYNGIPHLLAPVVTNPKKAAQALQKVVSEMERRYELFSHSGTRNIEGYNDYINRYNIEEDAKQPLLPYIVVIVDELADLMMVASNDVEDAITRLAQMARAAGIHLIIATQRPSVDVITGVIKANIPSRIAFSVSSMTDSRTILDMGGAEKLLGRGDMLFLPSGASKPVRVQGAFLSDNEVEEVVTYVISQQKAQYNEEMIPDEIAETSNGEVEDDLYGDAVSLIVEMQTASVSMLQRRFRIGYTRAARLIDEMEARGIVGPYEGSKPRNVLVTKDEQDEAHSS
ncbi:DNA translocase FtsK [Peribacillus frigoritolerans]|jgi:DNA segregation ATPase FtsK/SpoIIIE, S-DNA-T family|uniref:DNA translocase FtsK n=1 Tax=Peribacillus frigoritolerans TaxID=450367 RepID=UPI000709CA74|nr:DNA translocase FtsK [Peribacillus frigoritolerans]KRF50308.1 cell division protein FtsK [Bacillus sp. Soil745]MBD8134006.1 DNA translocase FtsK [Bacillus sp. CFBP 13597]MDP9741908.1 S-DNA-T family DNA segregation ATPase FtsK/SpoIIIE [Bacillus sp. B2I3]PAW29323.1 DNA translocase FtsK [Peribacillus simplex]PEF39006.1 DNA translocase FtsK [Bacillus sp. AFS094228]PEO50894.1 DNA translocase FtsK [Bacillus sp. AFS026049]PHD75259.1 DNA translocase FtsK [Bacillus sp. AFS043905]QNK51108.1 DNA tr